MPGKNAFLKTTRCKAYTVAGDLVSRACPHGNQCRYLHPEDVQWPGKKFRSTSPTRFSRNVPKTSGKASRNRSSLPSQDSIFSSMARDDGDFDRSPVRSGNRRSRSPDSPRRHPGLPRRPSSPTRRIPKLLPMVPRNTSPWRGHDSPRHRPRSPRDLSPSPFRNGTSKFSQPQPRSRSPMQAPIITSGTSIVKEEASPSAALVKEQNMISSIVSEKVSGLWRDIATASRASFQNVEALKEHEAKVDTCTQFRDMMSRVSASAEAIMKPTLSDLLVTRDAMKANVEGGFKAVDNSWNELFAAISCNISTLLEGHVQAALETMKTERIAATDEIKRVSSTLSQKRRLDDDEDGRSRHERDSKRTRRTLEREHSSSSLTEAKRIMREQNERLEALAKENAELKSRAEERVKSNVDHSS